MSMYAELSLKKNEERRLRAGHLWVYSNEVDVHKTPLKNFQPGEVVRVLSHAGKCLGLAYVNPNTLLSARILSPDQASPIDIDFFKQRIRQALNLRANFFAKPYYRLVYGESDFLPGIVVDRFSDIYVVQITTAGMENLKDIFLEALVQEFSPKAVVWRNDSAMRQLENLDSYVELAYGTAPEFIELEENGARFAAPLLTGQKTAWFYDHRDNRALLQHSVKGKRVLDVFSYLGAWGIEMLVAGAREVVSIDSSASALEQQHSNAKLNEVANQLSTINDDAFTALKKLNKEAQKFDVIIVDPPAFIKRRKDTQEGLKAYFHINDLALKLLANKGLLVSASCSQHLAEDELLSILRNIGLQQNTHLKLLTRGHQGFDHPVHLAIPETEYLKALFINRVDS